MPKQTIRIGTILLLLSITSPGISQQVGSPARFKGIVLDAYDGRVPAATILISGKEKKWQLETDKNGKTIGEINLELPAGIYDFTVEAQGFKMLLVNNYRMRGGSKITYKFRLQIRDCDDCKGLIAPRRRHNR